MKLLRLHGILIVGALALLPCSRSVAEEGAKENKGPSLEFRIAVRKAIEHFDARNFAGTIQQCEVMEKIAPASAVVINMRAAVAIEERRLEEGNELCRKALELDPRYFPARFNLAEILFLQKKFAESRDGFEQLLAEDPANELVQYRVFLTYLLEGNDAAAEDALKRIKYPGNSGAYYYAKAAWAIKHGQQEEGDGWIKSGDWVFSRQKNYHLAEALYDLGWLKRPADGATAVAEVVAK